MPVGLDGHPDPLVTAARTAVIERVADEIERIGRDRVAVGIDGRSGVGKSTFADEVGRSLSRRGHVVVRSTTDLFHRPRIERMRLGATSAAGYYEDSHQIDAIVAGLIEPFVAGADEVSIGAFDEPADEERRLVAQVAPAAILVFDGLFLHRPELVDHWHLSVMLEAEARCDARWLRYLEDDLPEPPIQRAAELDRRLERARWPRYRKGWSHYIERVGHRPATIHIDNDDLAAPRIVGAR
jgi:uridine kinase